MQGIYLYRPWDRTSHPAAAATRAPHYLATWLATFPASQPSDDCDFEDWAENAVLLHEARKRDLPVEIMPEAQAVRIVTSGWLFPASDPQAPTGAVLGYWAQSDLLFGLPTRLSLAGQTIAAVDAASDYVSSPVFQRHCGRRVLNAPAVEEELEETLAELLGDRPHADIFVKTLRKKRSGMMRIEAGRPLWPQFYDHPRWETTAWEIERFRGNRHFLLMQDVMRCSHEYRFFVVGGELVTGAGCIEAFTPLDNLETFDPQMETIRNRSEVSSHPDVRDRHLDLARRYVAEFSAEHGDDLDYCLDVCLNEAGESVVIEMNPPINCGRYASDVGAWMDAVVARTETLAKDRR